MSHFTVLVVADNRDDLKAKLVPFQENCPREYMVFNDKTNEKYQWYIQNSDLWLVKLLNKHWLANHPDEMERISGKRVGNLTFIEFMRRYGDSEEGSPGRFGHYHNPRSRWDSWIVFTPSWLLWKSLWCRDLKFQDYTDVLKAYYYAYCDKRLAALGSRRIGTMTFIQWARYRERYHDDFNEHPLWPGRFGILEYPQPKIEDIRWQTILDQRITKAREIWKTWRNFFVDAESPYEKYKELSCGDSCRDDLLFLAMLLACDYKDGDYTDTTLQTYLNKKGMKPPVWAMVDADGVWWEQGYIGSILRGAPGFCASIPSDYDFNQVFWNYVLTGPQDKYIWFVDCHV